MRWILVEAADRVLPEVPPDLADYAVRELRGRGIDIRLGTRIEEAAADSTLLSTGERDAHPDARLDRRRQAAPDRLPRSSLPLDETGRVRVDERMRVEGAQGVWAIGDCAAVPHPDGGGRACPPTAAMAVRQGPAVARNIACRARRRRPAAALRLRGERRSSTSAATRRSARSTGCKFRGFLAWWMARTYHMSQIPGLARKIRAVVDWTVGLPFRRDTAEVGSIGHPRPLSGEVYARGGTASAACD